MNKLEDIYILMFRERERDKSTKTIYDWCILRFFFLSNFIREINEDKLTNRFLKMFHSSFDNLFIIEQGNILSVNEPYLSSLFDVTGEKKKK